MCSFAQHVVEGKTSVFLGKESGADFYQWSRSNIYSAAILAKYLRRQQAWKQVTKYWYLRVFPASKHLEICVTRSIKNFFQALATNMTIKLCSPKELCLI